MLTPLLAFVLCAGICLSISQNENRKFKEAFSELIWPIIWFSFPCSLVACVWVFIALSEVAQGALFIFIAGPVGFTFGEFIGLVFWIVKRTKPNTGDAPGRKVARCISRPVERERR